MDAPRGFVSDNCSGAHPAVLEAMASANEGHAGSYGSDLETARLDERNLVAAYLMTEKVWQLID